MNTSRSTTSGRSCIDSSTPSGTGRLMSCSTSSTSSPASPPSSPRPAPRVASLRQVIGLTGRGDRLGTGIGVRLRRNAHRYRKLRHVWRCVACHRVHRDPRTHREDLHPSCHAQHRLHRPPPRTAVPCTSHPTPGLPISGPVLTAPAGVPQPGCASPPVPFGLRSLADMRSCLSARHRVTSTAIRRLPHRYSRNHRNRRFIPPILITVPHRLWKFLGRAGDIGW